MEYRRILLARYRSSGYAQFNPDDPASLQRRDEAYRQELSDLLPPDRGSRILDLGCGSGLLVDFLLRSGYKNVLGVDASAEQVSYARGKGLPVTEGDALSFLERPPHVFDAIIATDFIEHLTKDETVRLLHDVHRALAPGGCLILQTPNASSPYGPSARYNDYTHEDCFTETSLRQVLMACGFADVSIDESKIPFGLRPRRLVRWLLAKLLRPLLRLVYLVEVGDDCPRLFGKLLIAKARKAADV